MKTRTDKITNAQQLGLYSSEFEHDACGVGFIADIKARRSHELVNKALDILLNLNHRGASGSEPNTGDGAGILIQVPHLFLQQVCSFSGIKLPRPGKYGTGFVFLPKDPDTCSRCESQFEKIVEEEGLEFLGWRNVPVNNGPLGDTAKKCEPIVRQIFIRSTSEIKDQDTFERKLFVVRRRVENEVRYSGTGGVQDFYVVSLSSRTIVYKGMLTAGQLGVYYPELSDPLIQSALAVVHSRFSTNTFPSWERAHPYRYIAHNGEINTLRGNINWMHARQALFRSSLFGKDLEKVLPVICQDGSDSAMFDNALEMLVLGGRSLPHALMMMIPEPWQHDETMPKELRSFYEFHRCLMEPWDGPASIAFSDGKIVGAVLDRNGLRPARYCVTRSGLVIMASETGVLDLPASDIITRGRLQPGKMLLVDLAEKRIITNDEIKNRIASVQPYDQLVKKIVVSISQLPVKKVRSRKSNSELFKLQQVFGYTYEDQRLILAPMVQNGVEPIGSMGTDTPLAVLSEKPQLLYNYFKELFAQVTNPPIDYLREYIVTSTETLLGCEGNLIEPDPKDYRFIRLECPILTDDELEKLKASDANGINSVTLPIVFDPRKDGYGIENALDQLNKDALKAIDSGKNIIILSDRMVDADRAPIPALLAVSSLHHYLVRVGKRTKLSIVVESGEPREVHHFALLLGYGASAINPWLAFETIDQIIRDGLITDIDIEAAHKNYIKAIVKGILKVISKMGISTIQSYRGAQIFEAVGLCKKLIDKYFTGTPSRLEGIGLEEISQETIIRHNQAFENKAFNIKALPTGGQYQWRADGEYHLMNPESIYKLQLATRTGSYELFKEYTSFINEKSRKLCTLRSLFEFKYSSNTVPIDEVEPVEAIVKRFKTGAMSYGSISKEAHETLAIAMNRIGGKSNTGEGGEDPARYEMMPNGDSLNSAIKQVASGRFGVTSWYLINAKELQIKMAQGAKPGEGGQLPGTKVYPWIAKVRHSTPGVGLISPPPHHDIYSIEDLAELIFDLKNANPSARVSVKLVAEVGVGTIAAGVAKAKADVVLISGHDGGTGASPLTAIKHTGLPWELGLAETHQTLVLNNLRDRITIEVDGQLRTGRDVVIGALLGAEEFGFATAPLVTLGCIMMRACHSDNCPVGIATQNPELRKNFSGKPEYVINFMRFIAQEVRELMAQLGFRSMDEMIGRSDLLEKKHAIDHWKARGLDFSRIFYRPEVQSGKPMYHVIQQDCGLNETMDKQILLRLCEPALENKSCIKAVLPIKNFNRAVGTMLGSEVSRRYGLSGLPEDTIWLKFKGSAGQSFGAFMPEGITFELEGDANDYIGKGLSGAKLIVYPPRNSSFQAHENIIIGNVALYGATSGEAYFNGIAGERFCVRNSGANAVVEGTGDHACEYMTGGRVIIIGKTGRNFAAGMTGGIAYVLDYDGTFEDRCNLDMVDIFGLENQEAAEIEQVRKMIELHKLYTGSKKANEIIKNWQTNLKYFVKVLPKDYARVLFHMKKAAEIGLAGEDAVMAAFNENRREKVRVSGE